MKSIHGSSSPFVFITPIWLIMVLCVAITFIGNGYSSGADGDVSFSDIQMKPKSGEADTEFAFTVRVTANQQPDDPVEIVIQGIVYEMTEVNPGDQDYQDGKDYQFTSTFDQGPKYYFIRCGESHTGTNTLYVEEDPPMEYHPDLALAMIIYTIPVIYLIILMKRFTKTSKRITSSLKTIENGFHGQHMGKTKGVSFEKDFPTLDSQENRMKGGME